MTRLESRTIAEIMSLARRAISAYDVCLSAVVVAELLAIHRSQLIEPSSATLPTKSKSFRKLLDWTGLENSSAMSIPAQTDPHLRACCAWLSRHLTSVSSIGLSGYFNMSPHTANEPARKKSRSHSGMRQGRKANEASCVIRKVRSLPCMPDHD